MSSEKEKDEEVPVKCKPSTQTRLDWKEQGILDSFEMELQKVNIPMKEWCQRLIDDPTKTVKNNEQGYCELNEWQKKCEEKYPEIEKTMPQNPITLLFESLHD